MFHNLINLANAFEHANIFWAHLITAAAANTHMAPVSLFKITYLMQSSVTHPVCILSPEIMATSKQRKFIHMAR